MPLASSWVRVTVCLPAPRLVLDQSSRWFTPDLLVAFTRVGVEPSMDTVKTAESGPLLE